MRVWLVALAVLACAATPAAAQSKKYPPTPVDKDAEAAQKSRLWDEAINPKQTPYAELVKDAQQLLGGRTDDARKQAVAKLDQAVALMPDEPDAYRVRGDAHMELQAWARCAADYQTAWAKLRRELDVKGNAELRKKLALCLARDGKLADAERTLAEAAATGVNSVEIWMRLGEIRIAMGKLEEAIAALESAIEQTDISAQVLSKWLLAGAYDRARRPSEAVATARAALASDGSLSQLKNPTLPLLGAGEAEYLIGLAHEARELSPRPELALIYFRRFLALAPDSPWRRRAEDHIRELKTARLPEVIERIGGSAPLELGDAREAVRKAMPAMRACMAKLPTTVMYVEIIKVGPRTPPARDRARYAPPPASVTVRLDESLDAASRVDVDTAARCIEPHASRIALPAIKDRDAWYKLQFRVVGP